MNYAIVCRHLGLLLIVVSGCMGAPMAWWLGATYRGADTDPDVILAFGITIAVGVLTGGVLAWLGRRPDGNLRRKEALLLVADEKHMFLISGQGDLIEPDDGMTAIGSGGPVALAAACALMQHTQFSAREVVAEAMVIAGKSCIYTNDSVTIEEL